MRLSVVHNVLMIDPPGAGKTLLARAMPGILPRMTIDEALDVTCIYSVADQLPPDTPLIQNCPFRAPHHPITHTQGSLTFPANFQLIAAMNPCPCGYSGDALKPCTCRQSPKRSIQVSLGSPW